MDLLEQLEAFATFAGALADIGAFFDGLGAFGSGSADLSDGFIGSIEFFSNNGGDAAA